MRHLFLLLAVIVLGAGLRIHGAARDHRFHPDEALFSTFARHAATNGDWLLHGDLDKPPLFLYASTLSMTLFAVQVNSEGVLDFTYQQGEFAARLPNVFAGILFMPLMYSLARYLYRDPPLALWATLFAACSPLLIGFSASAFTDMLMLICATIGLRLTLGGRWTWGGVWLALALTTKVQAFLLVPLILALVWAMRQVGAPALRPTHLIRFGLPVLVGILFLVLWDAARGQSVSWWTLAGANNLPNGLTFSFNLLQRTGDWLLYTRALIGDAAPIFAIALPFHLYSLKGQFNRRSARVDVILTAFIVGYTVLHLLINLPLYDRYLLPLAPAVCLLSVRAGAWLYRLLNRLLSLPEARVATVVVVFTLGISSIDASNGSLRYDNAVTSFPDNGGIEEIAAFLNEQHVAAVVYDHWMRWLLGYYLGEWHDKRITYYPTPEALVSDALALQERERRYFPMPTTVATGEWLAALEAAGFAPEQVFRAGDWVVYALTPPD